MHSAAATHYDFVASKRSVRSRTPLQKFHNDAKRALLETFAADAESLLDLACGRGGDVHKWMSLGLLAHVTGLDVSSASVEEARRRLRAASRHPRAGQLECVFEQADLRRGWSGTARQYDVVTCMFAMHYFFGSERDAHTLMRTAAAHLKDGGVFLGIVPDGQRINECIKYGPQYDNGTMRVRALWKGKPACFGSAYTFNISDTVTESSDVPEFLVYDNVLRTVAAAHGLRPVAIHHPMFAKPDSPDSVFHRLVPPYDGALREASSVFVGFALKKFCVGI